MVLIRQALSRQHLGHKVNQSGRLGNRDNVDSAWILFLQHSTSHPRIFLDFSNHLQMFLMKMRMVACYGLANARVHPNTSTSLACRLGDMQIHLMEVEISTDVLHVDSN